MNNALIIFAKSPVPGRVKTRLVPALTLDEAAALYEAMLLDTLAKACGLSGVACRLFYQDEPGGGEYFLKVAAEMSPSPQAGTDLGERMERAFAGLFGEGATRVAIIGTDSPDLPPQLITRAFDLLAEGAELVFGPTEDGGYYLLAMKSLHVELFRDIPWSTGRVLELSMDKGKKAGLRMELLPIWYDVDTPADLQRPGLAAEESFAKRTREFIRNRFGERGTRNEENIS